ncbi:MAG: hypothetical protein ACOYS2_03350 [Patescibacteria group bacterium]
MDKYFWTEHAKFKLKQYGLSEQRIKRVLRNPYRKEEGIVKNTIAMMAPVSTKRVNGKETWKQEIWAMIQNNSKIKKQNSKLQIKNQKSDNYKLQTTNYKLKIISVWRYPGVSPKNNPIPEDILREIGEIC